MAKFEGKCPLCGKVQSSNRKDDIVACDCWRYCPICGTEMTPYTPDVSPHSYGIDGKQDLQILMNCTHHSPPFFSTQKPAEVVCT